MLGVWDCFEPFGERTHVVPRDDWQPHTVAHTCWCRPRCEDDVWVHNSMDRREEYECGRLRLN